MDSKTEENFYRQIEKSLANNMNEGLIQKTQERFFKPREDYEPQEATKSFIPVSREEYIRQAREACLRQLNSLHAQEIRSNVQAVEADVIPEGRKSKLFSFHPDTEGTASLKEAKAFRLLIIRTVIAAVIFLCIFLFDKLKVEWNSFNYTTVRQYITQKDVLSDLETKIVSWLK